VVPGLDVRLRFCVRCVRYSAVCRAAQHIASISVHALSLSFSGGNHQSLPPLMSSISPNLTGLLQAIKHPIRLPILLALVQREAGATELARRFDVSFDTINHALTQLRKAGFIELVRTDPIVGSSLERRIYRSVRSDWTQLVEYLEAFAERG
jgi:DNA-binding transcriptional ArsR family regulator